MKRGFQQKRTSLLPIIPAFYGFCHLQQAYSMVITDQRNSDIMVTIKKVVVVVLAIVSVTAAVPEYFRLYVNYGRGNSAIQDVMLDEEEKYCFVAMTNVTGKVTASVNLHDFDMGFSVIKDVTNGVCYIKDSAHSMHVMMDEFETARQNAGNIEVDEYFTCTSEEIVLKSQLFRYGERIAAFCENYDSVFIHAVHMKRNRRSLQMMDEFSLWCVLCSGGCK